MKEQQAVHIIITEVGSGDMQWSGSDLTTAQEVSVVDFYRPVESQEQADVVS